MRRWRVAISSKLARGPGFRVGSATETVRAVPWPVLRTPAAVPRGLLNGPPRRPPRSLELRVLLGWGLLASLMALTLTGGILTACIAPAVVDEARFLLDGERVAGTYESAEATSLSINEKRVYEHFYQFRYGGEAFYTSSYSYESEKLPRGSEVSVEVVRSSPSTSRIVGQRTTLMSIPSGIVPVIGFLFALAFARAHLRRNRMWVRLLTHGVETRAWLVDQKVLPSRKGRSTTYQLTFSFEDEDGAGRRYTTAVTDASRLTDEKEERLLYDPAEPESAALLDQLPGRPRIERGAFVDTAPAALWPRLPVPVLCAVTLAFAVWWALWGG